MRDKAKYEPRSLRAAAACELLGIGRSTLWRWVAERHDFPRPRRLSARCTVFDRDELLAYRDQFVQGPI
jgi:prophage regulatory protein